MPYEWLWGQINRILPIKFALRLLAIEAGNIGEIPYLHQFYPLVSREARDFGIKILRDDKLNKRRPDERISTGFPIGGNEEASRRKYETQIITQVRKKGLYTGAILELGFALIDIRNGKPMIGLTTAGKALALLENPILDNQIYQKPLSDEEKAFYLEHIITNVPVEAQAFYLVLSFLKGGKNRPTELDNEILTVTGYQWSQNLVSTQRAGVIARLYELDLIRKRRSGLEVVYQLTPKGNHWLQRNGK